LPTSGPCVGFRSNFEKIGLAYSVEIDCRHNLRMPFSGIRGFRQARGQGARRLKRPAVKIVGKPASRFLACLEHFGFATAVFNEKRSSSRQSPPEKILARADAERFDGAGTRGLKWGFSGTRAHYVPRY
jgi:hypothetical protein